jgi:nicotinate-nucleotide adenylyltransferase
MKICIIGGTFNPVHTGHMILGEEVKKKLNYDRIIFVPAFIPAHKSSSEIIAAGHRLKMLKLAVAGVPYFSVDDCELKRKGLSYTYDTVQHISRKYRLSEKPGILVGADLVKGLVNWYRYEELLDAADIITARRGAEFPETDFPYIKLDNQRVDISSTQLRAALSSNGPVRYFIPDKVYKYIIKHALYAK